MSEKKSEWASIILIATALFGGMVFFRETLYLLPLTIVLIMVLPVYVLFDSRRKNSLKKTGGKPKQENKTGPDKGVEEKE